MNVPSWARVGAKVVCVSTRTDVSGYDAPTSPMPSLKAIYTIVGHTKDFYGKPRVILAEAPHIVRGADCGWFIWRFRPLVTRTQEQDVRAIKSMLRELPAETRLDRLLELLE